MVIRALLFDFDGTLADSFPAITASVNHVRGQYGLPPMTEVQVHKHVGLGLKYLLERLVPGAEPAAAVRAYRSHHETVMFSGTKLFEGVEETLAALQEQGRKLAVCSNKSVHFTTRLVEGLGLASYFPVVLGPEDVVAPKPDPAMLLEALRRLEVSEMHAVYVGDMDIDVETARAAGLPVWLMPGFAGDLMPDRGLANFRQILDS